LKRLVLPAFGLPASATVSGLAGASSACVATVSGDVEEDFRVVLIKK
jgi:hypothetical protein